MRKQAQGSSEVTLFAFPFRSAAEEFVVCLTMHDLYRPFASSKLFRIAKNAGVGL